MDLGAEIYSRPLASSALFTGPRGEGTTPQLLARISLRECSKIITCGLVLIHHVDTVSLGLPTLSCQPLF